MDGNLAVARATASKVAAALAERRPSPIGHQRTSPEQMVAGYLDYITSVQKLALRTQDRYRARASSDSLTSAKAPGSWRLTWSSSPRSRISSRWLRGQTRARNGSETGKRDVYKLGGVKFILSTCRTAFNWAARRRMLPPYAENPFTRFPIEKLRDRDAENDESHVFTPAQEKAFFDAC